VAAAGARGARVAHGDSDTAADQSGHTVAGRDRWHFDPYARGGAAAACPADVRSRLRRDVDDRVARLAEAGAELERPATEIEVSRSVGCLENGRVRT
jgi:monoamine oxidase